MSKINLFVYVIFLLKINSTLFRFTTNNDYIFVKYSILDEIYERFITGVYTRLALMPGWSQKMKDF